MPRYQIEIPRAAQDDKALAIILAVVKALKESGVPDEEFAVKIKEAV